VSAVEHGALCATRQPLASNLSATENRRLFVSQSERTAAPYKP
jgi:hypothetical protein